MEYQSIVCAYDKSRFWLEDYLIKCFFITQIIRETKTIFIMSSYVVMIVAVDLHFINRYVGR